MKAVDGLRIVLYEGASAVPLDSARRFDVMRLLLERGYAVTRTRQGGHVSEAATGTLVVLGQFAERQPPEDQLAPTGVQVYCREIDGLEAPQVVELVESLRREVQAPEPKAWKPWFPVIDYQRCTNCMQCLSFCLFDVYSVSPDGKIQVQHQSNCKTDCPACSRVCPEVAILFPKYKAGPINGEEINPDDVRREAMKVDISALLGGDIYAALRDRSAKAKSRFSKERDDERALKERQRCLVKMQQQMDIPPEVLASLPSVDEIRARAEAAKARAQAAVAANGIGPG